LLLDPPVAGAGTIRVCTAPSCAASPAIAHGVRHHIRCPCGMLRGATVHHPVVRQLISLLDAIFSPSRVIGERGPQTRGVSAVAEWMQSHPGVAHSPDIIVHLGGGRYTLIDVKTLDITGATHIGQHRTDRTRLAAHAREAERCRRHDYGTLPSLPGISLELEVIVVSTTGALSPGAQTFIRRLARRTGGHVPRSLLDQAGWWAPQLAPFVRMALVFAARRGLAAHVADTQRWTPLLLPPLPPPPSLLPPPPMAPPVAAAFAHAVAAQVFAPPPPPGGAALPPLAPAA